MQDYSERRFYERIHLLAYATGKGCLLDSTLGRIKASLVDIGNGGARVRVDSALALERGHELRFSLDCVQAKGLLQNLLATVRWQAGQDLGIRFETPLGLPLRTLQDLVS